MPYTWILECFKLYNIKKAQRAFIKNSMGLQGAAKPIAQVNMKCGICQGDSRRIFGGLTSVKI